MEMCSRRVTSSPIRLSTVTMPSFREASNSPPLALLSEVGMALATVQSLKGEQGHRDTNDRAESAPRQSGCRACDLTSTLY